MNKWLKRILGGIPVLLFVGLAIMTSCMTFRISDDKTIAYFEKKGRTAQIHKINFQGKSVRYIEAQNGGDKGALVIFVHGAPGSSRDLLYFLTDSILLDKARLISIDRLGYGYSDYGNAEVSITKQAELISYLVKDAPEDKILLVGHSFGGPIVAKTAVIDPKVDGVLMLAPVNDPYHEKMFKVSYFGKWKTTRWMLSKAFKVSADEKFAHESELLKMKDDWKQLNVPVVHIHGDKDWLAPIENVAWSEQNIPTDYLKMVRDKELDHFIPFKNQDLVVEQLMYLLNLP